jgi:hypothetical protein
MSVAKSLVLSLPYNTYLGVFWGTDKKVAAVISATAKLQ